MRVCVNSCLCTAVFVSVRECLCMSVRILLTLLVWQLLVFDPGKLKCPKQVHVMDINRNTKTDLPRLRQTPKQPSRIPIPAIARRGYEMAMAALPNQPLPVCVALL